MINSMVMRRIWYNECAMRIVDIFATQMRS